MAASASSSSDENSKAPNLNVQVSSDDDAVELGHNHNHSHNKRSDGEGGVASCVLALKCPLCGRREPRLQFHCRMCIRNGNIIHSTEQEKESLSEKQQKYIKLQAGLKDYRQRHERLIAEQRSSENVQFEIKRKKDELRLLNTLIAQKRSNLQALSEQHEQLHKANAEKRKHLPNYPIKVQELEDYVQDRIEKIGKLREKRRVLLDKLKAVTRRGIQDLVEYIFPISEIVLKDESRQCGRGDEAPGTQTEELETIAALADARNTSYIRGRWVFHGSGISEMQYRIVAPSLPANGDYSAYLDWLAKNDDDVRKTTDSEISPSHISAFRISGALTYTTQLTQLMSYYLNVRLPHKLAYGDFCKILNKEQFLRKVSRLNSNIMYLAYTQRVQLRSLNENHTLENITAILDVDKSDLGRHGFHEVMNAPLMKSVDSLIIGIETTTESESEDENSLRLDWEMPTQSGNLMAPPPAGGQQPTNTEGLITSAANRLSSIIRWMR